MIAATARFALPGWLCVSALALAWASPARGQSDSAPVGGNLAVTSDYIYRGVSQSDGHGALQADLHASSAGGLFAGIWASTRDGDLQPGTDGEIQLYLGQHFSLGGEWSATVSGRADYFVVGTPTHSDDHQEISAELAWLDRYTLSLTWIPNAVRYYYAAFAEQYYIYRTPAVVADAAGQWLLREELLGGRLYLTAAVGYYYASRPDRGPLPAVDYLFGNAGFALEWRRWRVDVGYFAAQEQAAELFPYPVAKRIAGTISWQF